MATSKCDIMWNKGPTVTSASKQNISLFWQTNIFLSFIIKKRV